MAIAEGMLIHEEIAKLHNVSAALSDIKLDDPVWAGLLNDVNLGILKCSDMLIKIADGVSFQ